MIDIDHETKSAFSENLSIPGEEAILLEPNMDQIESKLMAPNLTGTAVDSRRLSFVLRSSLVYLDVDKIEFDRYDLFSRSDPSEDFFVLLRRSKSGVWGMRNEKMETINGYQCKVYTANNFELLTRTRVEHMSVDDRKAYEAGHASQRNFLGGVFNFLESSASSSKAPSSGTASASATKPSHVSIFEQNDRVTATGLDGLGISETVESSCCHVGRIFQWSS